MLGNTMTVLHILYVLFASASIGVGGLIRSPHLKSLMMIFYICLYIHSLLILVLQSSDEILTKTLNNDNLQSQP